MKKIMFLLLDKVFSIMPKRVYTSYYHMVMEVHPFPPKTLLQYFADREMKDSVEAFGQPDYDTLDVLYKEFQIA